jgi:hypothetical protein
VKLQLRAVRVANTLAFLEAIRSFLSGVGVMKGFVDVGAFIAGVFWCLSCVIPLGGILICSYDIANWYLGTVVQSTL